MSDTTSRKSANGSPSSLFSVAGILMLLQIPLLLIVVLVYDRQSYQEQAVRDVMQMWGEEQTVAGPTLVVPYRTWVLQKDRTQELATRYARLLPNRLSVTGRMESRLRRRGIFDVPLFEARLEFRGEFDLNSFQQPEGGEVHWEEAFVSVYLSDARGLQKPSALSWNGNSRPFEPGAGIASYSSSRPQGGIHASVAWLPGDDPVPFSFPLELNGSVGLYFTPLGEHSEVRLESDWATPSFQGAWLPVRNQPKAGGFEAAWDVFSLGRGFPQFFDSASSLPPSWS